jgi:LysM repeat protein
MTKKEESEEKIKLSNEFKKDLKNKPETKWAAIIVLVLAIVVVFGALGIGTYEIFYKPEKVQNITDSEDKIQSRPDTEEQEVLPAEKTAPKEQAPKPTPAPAQTTPTSSYEVYVVVEGDTLSGIATKYDTTSSAIAKYNGFESPEVILNIGQKIKIPK